MNRFIGIALLLLCLLGYSESARAQEEIRVRDIGDKTVRVVNHGEEQILSFDDNPPKPPRAPHLKVPKNAPPPQPTQQ